VNPILAAKIFVPRCSGAGMFNAMTMAMGNGMASIGRRPPAPPAPQWMGETSSGSRVADFVTGKLTFL